METNKPIRGLLAPSSPSTIHPFNHKTWRDREAVRDKRQAGSWIAMEWKGFMERWAGLNCLCSSFSKAILLIHLRYSLLQFALLRI
jgi:hypothetical protein